MWIHSPGFYGQAQSLSKLPEEEFVRQLNSALQDRSSESGWVNTLASSLDLLLRSLTSPVKQTAEKPPVITGNQSSQTDNRETASHCR